MFTQRLNSLEDLKNNTSKKSNRKRKIIWFNPSFCKLSNINISSFFLKLMNILIIVIHWKKIFNRKTLNIKNYSCINNVEKIINSHNNKLKKFHSSKLQENNPICNCRIKMECPTGGNCLFENDLWSHYLPQGKYKPEKGLYWNPCRVLEALSKHYWDIVKNVSPCNWNGGSYLGLELLTISETDVSFVSKKKIL